MLLGNQAARAPQGGEDLRGGEGASRAGELLQAGEPQHQAAARRGRRDDHRADRQRRAAGRLLERDVLIIASSKKLPVEIVATVSVNSLNNVGPLTINNAMENAGAD